MKILKLILFVAILQFVLAFGFQPSGKKGFFLKGKIEGMKDGIVLYLVQYSTGDTIAKAKSKNGKFKFQGAVPKGTGYYFIRVDTAIKQRRSTEFLLVNDKLSLTGVFANWPKVILKNSEPNDEYVQLVQLWSKTQGSNSQADSIKKFINRNKNSLYIADLVRRVDKYFSLLEKEQMYQQLSQQAKNSYFGELLHQDLILARKRETIKEGTIIPEFAITLPDGSKTKALDIISKSEYTLIDFWASWCKPCRAAVPGMKKVYDDFHKKGFNILSIAISDKESDWKKAIAQDNTPWTNVRDANNICDSIFDIPAIPGFILVDRNGQLLAYSCTGSKIEKFGPALNGDTLYETISQLMDTLGTRNVQNSNNYFGENRTSLATNNNVGYEITKRVRPLKIGEKVPDIVIGESVENPLVSKRISDYRGKFVLLDFWSTWCTICISLFPKIEALQNQFKDKMVILPVGFDANKEGSIRSFLQKRIGTKSELKLPSVIQKTSDTLLMKLFPFSGLPHVIWIDKEGTLIGITDYRAVTESNIRNVINGNSLTFKISKPLRFSLSATEPFLINVKKEGPSVYGSCFAGFIDSLSCISSGRLKIKENKIRFYRTNLPVINYYQDVYYNSLDELKTIWGNKRIVVEKGILPFYKDFSDTRNMDNWEYDSFARDNLFSYELILPDSYTVKEVNEYIVQDLDRHFGVESKIETRNTKYLALVRTSKNDRLFSTHPTFYSNENDSIVMHNGTIGYFIDQLNFNINTRLQIIDETNYSSNIDICISTKDRSPEAIKEQLKKYDLTLIEKHMPMSMLILKDVRK